MSGLYPSTVKPWEREDIRPAIPETYQAVAYTYGPTAQGEIADGLGAVLWGLYVGVDGKVYTSQHIDGQWQEWVEQLVLLAPISAVAFEFDINGWPMVAFVRKDKSYGIWYRVAQNLPQLIDLGTGADQFMDLRQTFRDPLFLYLSDVIFSYTKSDGNLYIRKSSESFGTEHVYPIAQTRPIWIARSGRTNDFRFNIEVRG